MVIGGIIREICVFPVYNLRILVGFRWILRDLQGFTGILRDLQGF